MGGQLLDYVYIHTYFATHYNGRRTDLTTEGDTV
jgi:hypothetical protein